MKYLWYYWKLWCTRKKKFSIDFLKQGQNFTWVYITMVSIVICLMMKKKSLRLKPIMEILTQFCLGSISNGFVATKSK